MTNETKPDFSGAVNQSPGMNEREGLAETIHKARFYTRPPTPFADEDAIGRAYCFRIADAILALRAPAPSAWQPIETAPKDGTRVILSWDDKSVTGYWLDNSKTTPPWAGWKVPSMEVWPRGRPDAWQPFPALPSSDRRGVGELDSAKAFLREKPSTSYLQRKMSITYNHAVSLMETLENEGFISKADSAGRRTVLTPPHPRSEDQS